MNDSQHVAKLVQKMSNPFIRKATKYVSKIKTIKLTRIAYKNKPNPKNSKQESFLLTIGKPSYAEKKFMKRNSCVLGKQFIDSQFFPTKK